MDNYEAIEIGKRIHDKRIELHITQEELGAAVGMNKSTVQRYETGQVKKSSCLFWRQSQNTSVSIRHGLPEKAM